MRTADVYTRFKRDGGRYFLCILGEGSINFHEAGIYIWTALRFIFLFMTAFGKVSELPFLHPYSELLNATGFPIFHTPVRHHSLS